MLTAGIFFAGLLAYALSSHVLERRSVTPQVALLAVGLVVGWVAADSLILEDVELLERAGEIALVLCLYVDAARIDIGALRGSALLPVRLLTIGLPLTIVAGALVAILVLPGILPIEALLLALLVAPTDAALGALVVNSPRVPIRVRQALNVESGLNDGLVTPLVLVVAALIAAGLSSSDGWLLDAVAQIAIGTATGVAVGGGSAWLVRAARRHGWIHAEAHWIMAPAIAFLTWFAADALGGNAFVAAFVAGAATAVVIRHLPDDLLEFGEVGGELLGLLVFFLVGILLPTAGPFEPAAIVYAVLALTVIRMVPVAISLVGTGLAPTTVLFMGWFGPRGLASVVLAIVAIGEVAGSTGAIPPLVLSTVILTIALSVLAHGLSAGPAVKAYARAIERLPAGAAEREVTTELRTRQVAVGAGRSGGRHPSSPGIEDGEPA